MRHAALRLGLVLACLALSPVATAQSTDILLNCSTCHTVNTTEGTTGRDIYPNLNGQPARYIERQLRAYRDGRREHRQMSLTATALGDGAGAMARLYADAPVPYLEFGDPLGAHNTALALVNEGDWSRGLPPCASCHALDPEDDRARAAPRIHGQPEAYLGQELRAYAEGTRRSGPMGRMQAFSQQLTPSEISALARYYAAWKTPPADPAAQEMEARND
ncbi:MAG: cytochrome c [Pelagibaca sp.]